MGAIYRIGIYIVPTTTTVYWYPQESYYPKIKQASNPGHCAGPGSTGTGAGVVVVRSDLLEAE